MRGLMLALAVYLSVNTASAAPREFKIEIICARVEVSKCASEVSQALRLVELQTSARFKVIAIRSVDLDIEAPSPLPFFVVNEMFGPSVDADGADLGIALFLDTGDNVRGISYVGSLGLTSAVLFARESGKFTIDVIAHEVCHSLGARHAINGLMTPALSDPNHSSKLSKASKQDIAKHLDDTSQPKF